MSSHKASILDRIRQENIILILQNTTEIFSARKTIDGIGCLNKDKSQGFFASKYSGYTFWIVLGGCRLIALDKGKTRD